VRRRGALVDGAAALLLTWLDPLVGDLHRTSCQLLQVADAIEPPTMASSC